MMKEKALHIKVVLVPLALEVAAEILDREIELYETMIEDGAGDDTLGELAALTGAQYKLLRAHMFGHTPEFTRVELVAMDDALAAWIEMNDKEDNIFFIEDFEMNNKEDKEDKRHYACIALNEITKAIQTPEFG